MQNITSRIRPPRAVVEQIEEYLLSQVGVYETLNLNVNVPPPPRTRGYVEDLDLRVEIIPPHASEKYNRVEAKYDSTNSVLYVNLPYFEKKYEGRELAEALYRVVAHELVHVYQILYTRSRDGDPRSDSPTAGLPGLRERTPQYRQETGEILDHRLDDNEFYPRLEDTINAINFVARTRQDEIASIISYVVGESKRPAYRSKHLREPMAWLEDLGKYAPKKFLKAVRKIKNEFPETAKMRTADFFRQVSPPDELSTFSNGTPTGKGTDLKDKGEGSQMPNGDGARNIGRPSPDSPNLKSRNLDRSESYGRKPAEGFDGGYVHDSGSGSARVIPYDSGFANNSSPLRKASKRVAHRYLDSLKAPSMKTSARPIRIDKAKIKEMTKDAIKTLEDIVKKTKEETLSKAIKRKTRDGTIFLGSYLDSGSSIEIQIMVKETHENGQYIYNPQRGLHEIEIYLADRTVKELTHPYLYKMSIRPAMVKHIYSILIHEITHAVERIRYLQTDEDLLGFGLNQGSRFDKAKIKTRKDKDKVLKAYYNDPSEVKAYLQQIADEVEEYLNQKHGGLSKESLQSGWRDSFGYYGSKTWDQVSKYLTPKNQKYIKKAVLSHLIETIDSKESTNG
jgi:hypothetical protein